ncbi:autotransporter domain-containing protein [Paraburkholderia caballeronis]|uniref:Outer membrane autotransporter barrel domain-containing protein n=1 Tax=Paraburkholderia caballeronis TaxID=416943 RepID=A0A1H7P6R9_9BURK|nr:autotransporter domain-containing protein [Paraburkholderia caballeronis]PXW25368.1 outer membrane autotransporter protein [Paraburkholderia caballeronis]PXX00975.1 outer membrane autotransporter protein [Paraburkholderia caballeronis]RAJ99672.1 outer membrane autotransporter protein [Paraburkholderia caballeronis]SEE40210.1 outer membrane autotransporter barrel domain-containing protein [Paraburkholderia caballeronis]SEL31154.1 outer membrane autotransporter barrel domain-containing protei
MKKKQILLAVLGTLTVFAQNYAAAKSAPTSFTVTDGQTNTNAQTLGDGGSSGVVNAGGTLNVSDDSVAITVTGDATITNSGTIEQTGTGRAIRDNTGGLTLTVTNNAGATIESTDDDVIQMNKKDSNVTFYNSGTLISNNVSAGGAQAIDFNAITKGSNVLYNYATGQILATEADAVRPGVNGFVYNDGTIRSMNLPGSDSSSDGVDAQSNSGITIVNATTGTATTAGTGLIEGARHGITGGNSDVTTDGTFILNVTNNKGGTIQGDNGSGINVDGFNANEVVTIVNHGTISGNGVTADGDGVDVDGLVNLTNTGTIVSTHSYDDVSEGVTVGGGTIVNSGVIEGKNSATNADGTANSGTGRGITLAGLDKDPTSGDPIAVQGIYGNTSIVNSGLIRGDSDSAIAVTGAASPFSLTITNLAGGVLEGGGATAAAVNTGANDATVIDYGTITADASGKAVDLGSGNSSLQILGGAAAINGDISGGTGTSTLTIVPGAGGTFSYGGSISNFASVAIGAGTVVLSGANSYAGDTTLDGGTLVLANSSALGTGTLNTLDGATVGYRNGVDVANAVKLGSNTAFEVDGSDVATQAGAIGEAGNAAGAVFGVAKTGTGTLVLDGANTYSGGTLVSAGTLQVGSAAGSHASLTGDVQVNAGATLAGYGTIAGNVANQGAVAPGSGGGTLSVGGNYSQSADATLRIGVGNNAVATGNAGADSGYGRLVVAGSATMDAGSSVSLVKTGSYGFAAGQRFVVADASASGTDYNAGTLNYSAAGFDGLLFGQQVSVNGRSDLVVNLAGQPAGNLATTPNASASLSGLSHYSGVSPALLNLFNAATALSLGTKSEATRAGAQLAPAAQLSSSRAAAAPTFDAMNVATSHADSLRVAQAAGATGIATGDAGPGWGVWGQGFGGHASQGIDDNVDGYSANYGGLLVGADRAFGERWRAGGAFSYTNTAVNNTDDSAGDSTRVNGYGLIGYASYSGEPWYVNLAASVTLQRYDSTREIGFDGFSGAANGQFNGQQYAASAEFGYPLALGGFTLTPLVSLAYSYLHQNAYTESGGNGAALAVDASHSTSVRSNAGVKLEKGFTSRYGDIIPYLKVQWTHEYDHDRAVTGARFAADPVGETAFTTVGASPVSDLANLQLGVTLLRANNLSLTARYDLQAGSHFVSQTGSLQLRQLF